MKRPVRAVAAGLLCYPCGCDVHTADLLWDKGGAVKLEKVELCAGWVTLHPRHTPVSARAKRIVPISPRDSRRGNYFWPFQKTSVTIHDPKPVRTIIGGFPTDYISVCLQTTSQTREYGLAFVVTIGIRQPNLAALESSVNRCQANASAHITRSV